MCFQFDCLVNQLCWNLFEGNVKVNQSFKVFCLCWMLVVQGFCCQCCKMLFGLLWGWAIFWSTHKSTTTKKKQEQQINDENNLICYSFIHFLIWSSTGFCWRAEEMFRPTNITNRTKFPVYHTTLKNVTLWICGQTTFGLDGKNTFYSFNFESTQAWTTSCFF